VTDTSEKIDPKQECWTKRFYSFGTTKIFERRALKINAKRKVITFLGLASPLVVGAFAASFTIDSEVLKYIVVPIAGLVTVTQAVFSLWSLVAKWDDDYAYSVSSVKANTRLTADFENLAKASGEKITRDIERLRDEYTRQEMEDTARHITDKEKRFAQRSALFQYKSKCPTCDEVPQSMTPSNCDSCGNF